MFRPLALISFVLVATSATCLFPIPLLAQPPNPPQTRHVIPAAPSVKVTTEIRIEGGERILTYTVTPHRVFDMTDFHVKTLVGQKISGVSENAPPGWIPKANKSTKSYSWATGSSALAQPLREGRPTRFSLRLTNSNAQITPAAFWYATRNGKTSLPPLRPGGVTPRHGRLYVGRGDQNPPDARLRKKKPFIAFGPEPQEPAIQAPYATLSIPEYTLGEPAAEDLGITAGEGWTASAASTDTEISFTVLLSLDPEFQESRANGIVSPVGNDLSEIAMTHFFEGNTLDAQGRCGFSILLEENATPGLKFYALVLADDNRDGVLDLKVDLESDVYRFVVE